MANSLLIIAIAFTIACCAANTTQKKQLPTLYEFYTDGGITSGLSSDGSHFTLNGRNITLFSGAIHYFRVHPDHWRDRLRKVRAAGLLAVETYVAWNLHEPHQGVYDFGSGGTDFEPFLDIAKFVRIAQEEDLLVIVRPGPYICAEWSLGGLPSWLLREDIVVRSSDPKFISYVKRYYEKLFEVLAPLQFTLGGPIIAFQIENEYGSTMTNDKEYLKTLKDTMVDNGVVEMFFTSDGSSVLEYGTLPDVFATINLQSNPIGGFQDLEEFQPGRPLMIMEYWSGWFDHWTEQHHTWSVLQYSANYLEILLYKGASVNIYMFHGGTNWGFMNGGNIGDSSTDNGGLQPTTSSYDYHAPLAENGDYTEKYYVTKQILEETANVWLSRPEMPTLVGRYAYEEAKIDGELRIWDVIEQAEHVFESEEVMSMEMLPINNNSGQNSGYIVYRMKNIDIPPNALLQIKGRVCDSVMVLVNGVLQSKILETADDLDGFGYWRAKDSSMQFGDTPYSNATLDLVVENWARNNFGSLEQFNQKKGLWQGDVSLNGLALKNWQIIPLEFKKSWTNALTGWQEPTFQDGPALYKSSFAIEGDAPSDTYVDMRNFNKGIVIVNDFVLSRYLHLGPQQTAYLPGPLLKKGVNEIIIFEHFRADRTVRFAEEAVFEN